MIYYTCVCVCVQINEILMQKWDRENNSLPPSQRRPRPQRPVVGTDHSDWNTAAWEQSQVNRHDKSIIINIATNC